MVDNLLLAVIVDASGKRTYRDPEQLCRTSSPDAQRPYNFGNDKANAAIAAYDRLIAADRAACHLQGQLPWAQMVAACSAGGWWTGA